MRGLDFAPVTGEKKFDEWLRYFVEEMNRPDLTVKNLTVEGDAFLNSFGGGGAGGLEVAPEGASSKSTFGIGTTTVPHGGVGAAKLAIDGENASAATGPHVQFTTDTDDYPLMQIRPWVHDDVAILFDCYVDEVGFKSSDAGSNFCIRKIVDKLYFMYDSGRAQGGPLIWSHAMEIDTSGGVYINEAVNTNMTIGLTINQGENDDAIITLKSSDVAHLYTAVIEADTVGQFQKCEAAAGGLLIRGLKDADGAAGLALMLEGVLSEDVDTTKTTAGRAIVETLSTQASGGGAANIVADGNVFAARCLRGGSNVSLFIVDEDGDLHYDGTVTDASDQAFDSWEDAELCRAFDLARSPENLIRTQWDEQVRYNEQSLMDAGILGDTIEAGGLVNLTQLQRLHNGAIWQLHTQLKQLESKLQLLENGNEQAPNPCMC